MEISKTTSYRRADSFETHVVVEVASRHVFETNSLGFPEEIHPVIVTHEYLIAEMNTVGETPTVECYFSEGSYMNVVRGWVEHPDHFNKHYFYIEYQELYKSMVDGAVSAAKYSLGVQDGKPNAD